MANRQRSIEAHELKARAHAEKLRQLEAKIDAETSRRKEERRKKFVRPPERFTAPPLKTEEAYSTKGFLRELQSSKFHNLRRALQADNVEQLQQLHLGLGSQLSWTDTPVSCIVVDRFSASRTFQYTYLDGVQENCYKKHHPYLPSRNRELTTVDYCYKIGANNILELWREQEKRNQERRYAFETAKKLARKCSGCNQLVGDFEEHVFIPVASSDVLDKARFYHIPCCRCEDPACGIVLDAENFFLIDITWGEKPRGLTLLCKGHKLKQDIEKAKYERKKEAEANAKLAAQIKIEALRSKNPNEWVQVEDESGQFDEYGDKPKYWLHKGTGYTQWETPPVIQKDIDQKLHNEQISTIYVSSKLKADEKYLHDLKVFRGKKSIVNELVPSADKTAQQNAERDKRRRMSLPEFIRYSAARQELKICEVALKNQTTKEERGLGLKKLSRARQIEVKGLFLSVDKMQVKVQELKNIFETTENYTPRRIEIDHLNAEQALAVAIKKMDEAKAQVQMADFYKLKPEVEALKSKVKFLAPEVRRIRARRVNERNYSLRKNPLSQFEGAAAFDMRQSANKASRRFPSR